MYIFKKTAQTKRLKGNAHRPCWTSSLAGYPNCILNHFNTRFIVFWYTISRFWMQISSLLLIRTPFYSFLLTSPALSDSQTLPWSSWNTYTTSGTSQSKIGHFSTKNHHFSITNYHSSIKNHHFCNKNVYHLSGAIAHYLCIFNREFQNSWHLYWNSQYFPFPSLSSSGAWKTKPFLWERKSPVSNWKDHPFVLVGRLPRNGKSIIYTNGKSIIYTWKTTAQSASFWPRNWPASYTRFVTL